MAFISYFQYINVAKYTLCDVWSIPFACVVTPMFFGFPIFTRCFCINFYSPTVAYRLLYYQQPALVISVL